MTLFVVTRTAKAKLPTLSAYIDGVKVAEKELSFGEVLLLLREMINAIIVDR